MIQSLRRVLSQVDLAVYRVERALLVVSLAMMTLLVSLDVIQRTFSRPVSKTAAILLGLMKDSSPAAHPLVVEWVGPGLFGLVSLLFAVLAVHARRALGVERAVEAGAASPPAPGLVWSLVGGAALWLGAAGLIQLLLWLFPSSVPGAQKFALGFMLWSGMLGASLATRSRRHIVLDAVVKKIDPQMQRAFFLFSGLATALFCGFLGYLGALQLLEQYRDWAGGEGVGEYDALPIPVWIATLSVPTTFFVMAARFLANGVHDFLWGPPQGGADAHGVDLAALAAEAAPGAAGGEGRP